jgi:hypothetical protein
MEEVGECDENECGPEPEEQGGTSHPTTPDKAQHQLTKRSSRLFKRGQRSTVHQLYTASNNSGSRSRSLANSGSRSLAFSLSRSLALSLRSHTRTHVIPGLRGTPAGMITSSAPLRAEAALRGQRCSGYRYKIAKLAGWRIGCDRYALRRRLKAG